MQEYCRRSMRCYRKVYRFKFIKLVIFNFSIKKSSCTSMRKWKCDSNLKIVTNKIENCQSQKTK